MVVAVYDSLGSLPHFNPDLDITPLPLPVEAFRAAVASADALLISTPEYAHGIPGVLKNALDWLVSDPALGAKPVGLFFGSASAGSFAQAALIEVLRTMSTRVIEGAVLSVPGARVKVGPEGQVLDARLSLEIARAVAALAAAAG